MEEEKRMSVQFGMRNDVISGGHASRRGLHDHAIRRAEARRLQAEAIAHGVHRVWSRLKGAARRLLDAASKEGNARDQDDGAARLPGRASVAEAVRRDRERLARLVRRHVLEPYARWRRRRIAIDHLRAMDDRLLADIGVPRGQIELAVDGKLPTRGEILPRPDERRAPRKDLEDQLPLAA